MSLARPCDRQFQRFSGGAEKVGFEAFMRADGQQFSKQIHAGHPHSRRKANEFRAPKNTHAVDTDEITVGDISRENRIAAHINQLRDIESYVLQTLTA